ncbi:MAG: hypothetical protein Q9220_001598 [cf. Caloplaca sp. 1 TL-2023]
MDVAHLLEQMAIAAGAGPDQISDIERKQLLDSSLRLAVDMKIFDIAAELSSIGEPITTDKLAEKTGVDPLLMAREMRMLAGMQIFTQVNEDHFTSTAMTEAYKNGSPLNELVIHMFVALI